MPIAYTSLGWQLLTGYTSLICNKYSGSVMLPFINIYCNKWWFSITSLLGLLHFAHFTFKQLTKSCLSKKIFNSTVISISVCTGERFLSLQEKHLWELSPPFSENYLMQPEGCFLFANSLLSTWHLGYLTRVAHDASYLFTLPRLRTF